MKVRADGVAMRLWWAVATALAALVLTGGAALAEPPTKLTGLGDALDATGRIGVYTPESSGRIQPAVQPADRPSRTPELPPATERPAAPPPVAPAQGPSDEEYQRTDAPVFACRVEVARRRQVAPQTLAAGHVIVRFTVEPTGRVRNAEAIAASGTDLEIAACAKRVLSSWVFAKHDSGELTVEHTYRFP